MIFFLSLSLCPFLHPDPDSFHLTAWQGSVRPSAAIRTLFYSILFYSREVSILKAYSSTWMEFMSSKSSTQIQEILGFWLLRISFRKVRMEPSSQHHSILGISSKYCSIHRMVQLLRRTFRYPDFSEQSGQQFDQSSLRGT